MEVLLHSDSSMERMGVTLLKMYVYLSSPRAFPPHPPLLNPLSSKPHLTHSSQRSTATHSSKIPPTSDASQSPN